MLIFYTALALVVFTVLAAVIIYGALGGWSVLRGREPETLSERLRREGQNVEGM